MTSITKAQILDLVQKYALAQDLSPLLVRAQMQQESAFNVNAVSSVGALGLLQLMPQSFPSFTKEQLLDPETNIKIGTTFLHECIDTFKAENLEERLKFGLAAYNAGTRNIVVAQNKAKSLDYPSSMWSVVGVTLVSVTGLENALQTNWYVAKIMSTYETLCSIPAKGSDDNESQSS